MPGISPLIIQLFDDPHARHRHGNREDTSKQRRSESKGRVLRRRRRHDD